MGTRDPRVDAYIEKSRDFAKPILKRLRTEVHAACPAVQEGIKWGTPHYGYKGMFCMTAAFKTHCALIFWKGSLVVGKGRNGVAPLRRITSLADLPAKKVMAGYLKKAVALNDAGVMLDRRRKTSPKPVRVPPALAAALKKHAKAHAAFAAFPPSHRREYAEWVADAKQEATRARRVKQAIEWIADGKSRNWKYERC